MQVQDAMQGQVITAAEDESLGLVLTLMRWSELRHVLVLRPADGKLTGVISERDILRAYQLHPDENVLARQVREFMVSPPEHIHPRADLTDAAALLATNRIGCLPVVDAGELVGIITISDVLGAMAQFPPQPRQPSASAEPHVAEIMRPDPFSAHPDDPLALAAARMLHENVRHLCVVDGERKLVGILSDRDLRKLMGDPERALRSAQRRVPLAEARVQHAMTASPQTLDPEEPMSAAVVALLAHRFGALPVVDREQHPIGIVSYVDVLKHLADRAGLQAAV
jgi:acetoin utilization protein AcuB